MGFYKIFSKYHLGHNYFSMPYYTFIISIICPSVIFYIFEDHAIWTCVLLNIFKYVQVTTVMAETIRSK